MRRTLLGTGLLVLLSGALTLPATAGPAERRAKLDSIASETMTRLLAESESARELHASAYGWAVFDTVKISLGVTGAGGAGVAMRRDGEQRIYMKMGSAGLNLGLGGQKYQVVFLFQNRASFERFVESGWQAEAGASASAADRGLNRGAAFVNGMAVYQFTDAGLMLQADISGTKYWKSKKLNRARAAD